MPAYRSDFSDPEHYPHGNCYIHFKEKEKIGEYLIFRYEYVNRIDGSTFPQHTEVILESRYVSPHFGEFPKDDDRYKKYVLVLGGEPDLTPEKIAHLFAEKETYYDTLDNKKVWVKNNTSLVKALFESYPCRIETWESEIIVRGLGRDRDSLTFRISCQDDLDAASQAFKSKYSKPKPKPIKKIR